MSFESHSFSIAVILLAIGLVRARPNDCLACRALTDSFTHWLGKTSRGKFEGGDADWEESRLRSYSRSEIRLIEIQEGLCSELKNRKDECYLLVEEAERPLESWWFRNDPAAVDIYTWLCIETLARCCPVGHYGPECTRCPHGGNGRSCSGYGKCGGEGTRKGDGKCACNKSYSGDVCDKCAADYYETDSGTDKIRCEKCHSSCEGGCEFGGPKGCRACAKGWNTTNDGCVDIDECKLPDSCTNRQFCINNDGSHKCLDCDKSCETCFDGGSSSCVQCAEGYIAWSGSCIEVARRDLLIKRALQRLLLYIGLFTIICFVFRRSKVLAAAVVVVVSVYIFYAEYIIKDSVYFDLDKVTNLWHFR